MFKNIGKTLQIMAFALAGVLFVGFIALGVLCLMAAFADGVTEALQTAGIQATVICFIAALTTPFLCLVLYGFGTLIISAQKQAQDAQKTREMLQTALSDGMLSDEVARKVGQVQAKLLAHMQAQAPQSPAAQAPAGNAPVRRPVEQPAPVEQSVPATQPLPVEENESETDSSEEEAVILGKTAPAAPIPPRPAQYQNKPTGTRPAAPIAGATPLCNDDEESF